MSRENLTVLFTPGKSVEFLVAVT